jgi:hypothetical protein
LLAASAWGDDAMDPKAGVESDNFSTPISQFNGVFDPTANGGVLSLYNDTGKILTSLSLNTTIADNLTPADISSSFTCNSGASNPFFLFCGFDYVPTDGSLTIDFYGVNPPDPNELSGTESEVGLQRGIPPIDPACILVGHFQPCSYIGHFAFVFNDNLSIAGTGGNGWTPDATSIANPSTLLFTNTPLFGVQYGTAPEPSAFFLLGGGIFALAGWPRRRAGGRGPKQ